MGEQAKTAVTVVGLGAMGTALADALLRAGLSTTVWNRSTGKADPLVAKGAVRAATPADAVSASPVVIACVLDYAVLREIFAGAEGALSGRVLVNLTNGTPDEARETAGWAESQGAGYVDGGIMAMPPMVGAPEALILYSGSEAAFGTHREVLDRLGTSQYLGADPGLASLHDLALLSGMYGLFAGFLHAVALVGAEQVRATEFTESLLIPLVDTMTAALPELARQVDAADYRTEESNLGMQAAALSNIVRASETLGIRTDLIAPMRALVDRRVADGHAGDDVSSLVELIRSPGGS